MNEKDLLKAIKKIIVSTTPNNIPMFHKTLGQKQKSNIWPLISFATLTATAIVVALSTSTANLDNPNRNFLQAFANTMVNPGAATTITASTNSEIYSRIAIPNYETENTFKVDAEGELKLNNNESIAKLLLTINRFELSAASKTDDGSFSYDDTLLVEQEIVDIYFDGELAFVDLTEEAAIIPQLLFPSANRTFPTQFKTPFPYESLSSLIMPDLNEANLNELVEAYLPMVEDLNLLENSLSGNSLVIRYEITQSDLPMIYETMFLGTRTRAELNAEEIEWLDEGIARALAGITLNQFELAVSLNLLSNKIESVLVDIDVENFYRYDLTIPNGDEEVPYFVEWTYHYDIFFTAQIETFENSFVFIAPVNKEEYELIELEFEDPYLF
jgi:hypothetical protein